MPAMPKINIPGPCPYCGSKKFARITQLNFTPVLQTKAGQVISDKVLGIVPAMLKTPHYFALIMCTTCGKADWFSQNPQEILEHVGDEPPLMIEVNDEGGKPYR
jgi:hypothetical protein